MKKVDLGDFLSSLDKLGINQQSLLIDQDLNKIKVVWKDLVGAVLGDHSEPVKLTEIICVIQCNHSLVSQELKFSELEILKKINKIIHPRRVQKLQFKVGKV
ncbi:hypothetical protein LPTSP4_28630 [Leptospira ryugenii]|uniref:DUF721 domain-containing protein n=1 Tax=Leptospira ryugenii TaxID=1917863 RepID=A0A2P2E388_9LEPT|nr:DUF721 domain-containing protein [Leptospira ryugenii]GBF51331.1 hypothetical protein LPTSP4_28630 [Leptospira ryugenii]